VARYRLLALASAPLLSLAIAVPLAAVAAGPAAAASPPATSSTVAAQGASYLAGLINAAGFVPTSSGTADLNSTAQAILALHAAGVGGTKADAAASYLSTHVATYLGGGTAATDDAGKLAYAILVATATGANPTAYGTPSTNLVARLLATQNTYTTDGAVDAGLFGASDPTYDGATRQGLALAALHAAGVTNAAGSGWLVSQQCADGGWEAYRSSTTAACTAPDPVNFDGEDTNSTAYATEGLVAQGVTPTHAPQTFLHTLQATGGDFGYFGGSADPNSTGLVLQALAALGEDASGTSWAKGTATPYTALAGFQLGCGTTAPGAFFFPGSSAANLLATLQAIPGAAGAAFPLSARTLAAAAPSACPVVVRTSAPAAASTPAPTPSAAVEGTASQLPFTGSNDTVLLVIAALALLASGTAVVGLSQRRAGAHRP
jgi:hypothetical protein